MVAATLCGITDAKQVKRSICAMGHKWMWNASLGGLPPEDFLVKVDPLFAGVREKINGEFAASNQLAGRLSPHWAQQLGLKPGIPIPVGAFDAHWDAIGAGCRSEDIVNVVGTSTCIIGITPSVRLVPGVCGVVQGSVHPQRTGIEAGLSAVGDIFQSIATRAGTDVPTLCRGLENYRAGQTGLLRITWDNGDRTVLVNPNLRGITFGWNLQTTAQDKICPQYKVFQPQVSAKTVYDRLYAFYSKMYFAFGRPESADFGNLLPGLIQVSESAHAGTTR